MLLLVQNETSLEGELEARVTLNRLVISQTAIWIYQYEKA
jgi:hypothetical protein